MLILEQELNINSKYYKHILLCLKEFNAESRLVGGCVRDSIIGKATADIDIATALLPEQVVKILTKNSIKVIPTGIKFGTVSAFFQGEVFEITTLRNDLDCNGRHATVSFTNDFFEDASRRDFTINAISYCPFENKIYDYFGGLQDLKYSRLVFIGNPVDRIKEDFLRILRFFRFSCYYAKQIDLNGLEACVNLKSHLATLSKERIKLELDKLIVSDNAPMTLQLMFDRGIMSIIFLLERFTSLALIKAIRFKNDIKPFARYSLLFYQEQNLTTRNLIDLRFSKQEAISIMRVIEFFGKLKIAEADFLMKEIWLEERDYTDYIVSAVGAGLLSEKEAAEFLLKYNTLEKPKIPVTGDDLLRLGFIGKELGLSLNRTKKLWIESNFKLLKEELLTLI